MCKTFYGFTLSYTITCESCDLEVQGEINDDVKASNMDELV